MLAYHLVCDKSYMKRILFYLVVVIIERKYRIRIHLYYDYTTNIDSGDESNANILFFLSFDI